MCGIPLHRRGGDGNATESTSFTAANCGPHTRGWAGTITINGGTVTASGGERGAGIGFGQRGNGGTVTINGGTVVATGGLNATGVVGAESSINYRQTIETVHIVGGQVTAQGGEHGAGIGGGYPGKVGTVVIDDGTSSPAASGRARS